jgi:uncharacterized membrane protein YeiB
LFPGDVLGAYGLAGLLAVWLVTATDAMLLATAAVFTVPVVVLGTGWAMVPEPQATRALAVADPVQAVGARVAEWLVGTPSSALIVALPMVLGVWAGRRGVLDAPERHRGLLRRTAATGVGLAVLGGLPLDLAVARVGPDAPVNADLAFAAMHTLCGVAGGLGYAALVGLVVARRRPSPLGTALAACGERSLSCYLAQSVVFVAVMTPYAGGLGGRLGSAAAAGLATATWALLVVGAVLLARRGSRGPAEAVLRRLTYGSLARPEASSTDQSIGRS